MFKLPQLHYSYDALEPYIDARTMELHYEKHHQTYIDNLNAALKDHPDLQVKTLEELLINVTALPESVRIAVRNNGGGHLNHSLFWEWMTPKAKTAPGGKVAEAIVQKFGSFEVFQEQFNSAAKSRFGSGWAWLSLDKKGDLIVTSTANQDTPVSEGMAPLLGLDVWEHAYYLKYQNRRVDYIQAWWHAINWDRVEDEFRKLNG